MHSFYGEGNAVEVQCTTIKKILEDNNILSVDYLKLDCEGAEAEIFTSIDSSTLEKIQRIVMEYHGITVGEQIRTRLERSGYKVAVELSPYSKTGILRATIE